jgi:hypothetical protein
MPKDKITVNALSESTFVADDGGVTMTKANGAYLAAADIKDGRMMFYFHITAATAGDTVTISVPLTNIGGLRAGLGDLVYTCAGGAVELLLGPLETARFRRLNTATDLGCIWIAYAGSTIAGTAHAYSLPK